MLKCKYSWGGGWQRGVALTFWRQEILAEAEEECLHYLWKVQWIFKHWFILRASKHRGTEKKVFILQMEMSSPSQVLFHSATAQAWVVPGEREDLSKLYSNQLVPEVLLLCPSVSSIEQICGSSVFILSCFQSLVHSGGFSWRKENPGRE